MHPVSPNAGNGSATAASLYLPRYVFSDGTSLFVADAYNHRVLIWDDIPTANGVPADRVLGQGTFQGNTPNAGGVVTDKSLNLPTSVHYDAAAHVLSVADYYNNRVLLWTGLSGLPETYAPASVVQGQSDFSGHFPYHGSGAAGSIDALGFYYPYHAQTDGTRLVVSDFRSSRVLVWDSIPTSNQTSPAYVLGQGAFDTADLAVSRTRLSGPVQVWSDGNRIYVTDAASSRVLAYRIPFPPANGIEAELVVGQPGFNTNVPNQGDVNASSFYLPEQVHAFGDSFFVADRQAARVHVYASMPAADNASSTAVLGQASATKFTPSTAGPTVSTTRPASSATAADYSWPIRSTTAC